MPAPLNVIRRTSSLPGMQPNHLAFGIIDDGNKTVFANRQLITEYTATAFGAAKIDENGVLTVRIHDVTGRVLYERKMIAE
jgi:hypothetical protein